MIFRLAVIENPKENNCLTTWLADKYANLGAREFAIGFKVNKFKLIPSWGWAFHDTLFIGCHTTRNLSWVRDSDKALQHMGMDRPVHKSACYCAYLHTTLELGGWSWRGWLCYPFGGQQWAEWLLASTGLWEWASLWYLWAVQVDIRSTWLQQVEQPNKKAFITLIS